MIPIVKATPDDINAVLALRYEMLMAVNTPTGDPFDEQFKSITENYFTNGNQTTVLAMDGSTPVGCATICYISLMPTFSHPTGKRAHFMNVYTKVPYRRQGIAKRMMEALISEAKEKGITHLGLDATEDGRELYRVLGFAATEEGMELNQTGSREAP